MLKLANGMASKGYLVDLVLARGRGQFMEEVSDKVQLKVIDSSRVLTSLPGLVRYLRSERPQILVSALHYVNIMAILARYLSRVDTKLVISERIHYRTLLRKRSKM